MLLQPQHKAGATSQVSLICVASLQRNWLRSEAAGMSTGGLTAPAMHCLPSPPANCQQNCTKQILPLKRQRQAAPACKALTGMPYSSAHVMLRNLTECSSPHTL